MWLFLRGNRWTDIQMMTNEIRIYFVSFISTPSKHINILSKESHQLFLLLMRQLNSHLKIFVDISIDSNLLQLLASHSLNNI